MRALLLIFLVAPASAAITSTSETIQRVNFGGVAQPVTVGGSVLVSSGSTVSLASGTIVQIATGTNNIGKVSGSTVIVSAILGTVTVTPSTQSFSINQLSNYRSDVYTSTGTGFILNVSSSPLRTFAVSVTGVGAAATSWDARLEGSLDGTNFTQLLKHTDANGDGTPLYSGTTLAPSLFIRSRVPTLNLGGATAISVIILGVQ